MRKIFSLFLLIGVLFFMCNIYADTYNIDLANTVGCGRYSFVSWTSPRGDYYECENSQLTSNPPHNGKGNGRAQAAIYIVITYELGSDGQRIIKSWVVTKAPTTTSCSNNHI